MTLTGAELRRAFGAMGLEVAGDDASLAELARRLLAVNASQKRTYESAWATKLERFEAARAEAEDIDGLLHAMRNTVHSDGLIPMFLHQRTFTKRFDMGPFRPRDGQVIVVRNRRYRQMPIDEINEWHVVEPVAAAVRPTTRAVVELGCGWGRNLGALATHLGREDLLFVGAEQSESGRRCTERLLAVGERYRGVAHAFDYYAPDLSFLEGLEDVVVFTCAAIEQIAILPPGLIERILAACPRVTLVLFEPFGWQRHGRLHRTILGRLIAALRDGSDPTEIAKQFVFRLTDQTLEENAAVWALCFRYNMNLLSLIRDAETRGLARLSALRFSVAGDNLLNPYSLAVLEAGQDAD